MIAATSGLSWFRSCGRLDTRWKVSTWTSMKVATSAPGPEDIGLRPRVDIRDVEPQHCAGYDAVVCLAALSNDPVGHLNPSATYSINLEGTLRLGEAAKKAGVARFLFASSCSLYGAAGSQAVTEDAELFPVTPYGETKVLAERGALSALPTIRSVRPTFVTPLRTGSRRDCASISS